MSIAILSILAAASSGMTPVRPVGPSSWVTNDDYPKSLGNINARVKLALAVDTRGKAVRCSLIDTSGSAELDRYTCALVMARNSFKPAHDQSGKAVPGMFYPRFLWTLDPKFRGKPTEPDIVFTVSKLPEVSAPTFLQAWLVMSASGTPEACKLSDDMKDPTLESVVCPQLMRMNDLPSVTDATGTPIRGVTSVTFGFTLAEK